MLLEWKNQGSVVVSKDPILDDRRYVIRRSLKQDVYELVIFVLNHPISVIDSSVNIDFLKCKAFSYLLTKYSDIAYRSKYLMSRQEVEKIKIIFKSIGVIGDNEESVSIDAS